MSSLLTLRTLLTKNHLDAALLSSNVTIKYLTGYYGFSSIERDAYLLVTQKDSFLFTSPLYAHEVRTNNSDLTVIERNVKNPFLQQFAKIIKSEGIKTVGIEDNDLVVSEYEQITQSTSIALYPLSLRALRIKKSDDEISKIKKACEIGDTAYEKIQQLIKSGITEIEVALELEIIIKRLGASLSFPTIVAFGKNTAVPHHHSDETPLRKNDIILIDFGVMYKNYCSDMTRTFFIGKPIEKQKSVYQIVLNSQQKAVDFLKNTLYKIPNTGVKASAVDKIAREFITFKDYPSIPHSLGHGIGLEVHEAPSLSPNSTENLNEGMVFSIEPGIYLPDEFGVRIEDLYAIENGSLIQLTQAKSSL